MLDINYIRKIIKMISLYNSLIFGLLILTTISLRIQSEYLIFNTSGHLNGLSVSLSTNLNREFSIYSPILIDNQNSTVKFIPNTQRKKFTVEPEFVQPEKILYNDYSQGEFWYSFKKPTLQLKDARNGLFAVNRVTLDNQTYNYLMPLFNLPLSYLNFNSLYTCENILVSYQKTQKLIDVVIFSESESWHLFPDASWGFRNKDENVFYSRQTYPLGLNIEIDVGTDKFCVLNDKLIKNEVEFQDKGSYTLQQLIEKFSVRLQTQYKKQQNNQQNNQNNQNEEQQL